MNDNTLKPCPFCGNIPELPDCYGTFYEFDCNCGIAGISIQISDLMTIEERIGDPFNGHKYNSKYIKRAEQEAIKAWNTRTNTDE